MKKSTSQRAYPAPRAAASEGDLTRLFQIMAAWWRGESLAAIATQHGISRQRVHAILARVACTAQVRRMAQRSPADSDRRAMPRLVATATECLLHPLAWRLTPRQRCALAWVAQGVTTVNTGHRMAASAQGVNAFLIGAQERLARLLAAPAAPQSLSQPVPAADPIPATSFAGTELADLEAPLELADIAPWPLPAAEE